MNSMKLRAMALVASLALSLPAFAQVSVQNAWIRGTVAPQKATGAFMQLTAAQEARLVAAATPVAGVTEIHEMRMDGDVMRMRPITALPLPAGKPVELKPGGYHLMLMDLKQPLKDGENVPITLTIEGRDGKRSTLEVQATVRPLAGGGQSKGHGH